MRHDNRNAQRRKGEGHQKIEATIDGDHLFVNFVVKGKNLAKEIALKLAIKAR